MSDIRLISSYDFLVTHSTFGVLCTVCLVGVCAAASTILVVAISRLKAVQRRMFNALKTFKSALKLVKVNILDQYA